MIDQNFNKINDATAKHALGSYVAKHYNFYKMLEIYQVIIQLFGLWQDWMIHKVKERDEFIGDEGFKDIAFMLLNEAQILNKLDVCSVLSVNADLAVEIETEKIRLGRVAVQQEVPPVGPVPNPVLAPAPPESYQTIYDRIMQPRNRNFSNDHIKKVLAILTHRARNLNMLHGFEKIESAYTTRLKIEATVTRLDDRLRSKLRRPLKFKMEEGVMSVSGEDGNQIDIPHLQLKELKQQELEYKYMLNDSSFNDQCSKYFVDEKSLMNQYLEEAAAEEAKFRRSTPLERLKSADCHCHFGGSLSQHIILEVIQEQLASNKIIWIDEHGRGYTLKECFVKEGVPWENLTVYNLLIDGSDIKHFASFEEHFVLFRNVFLDDRIMERDGLLQGRLVATMWQREIQLRKKHGVRSEVRISVKGKSEDEWAKWANFFKNNKLIGTGNIRSFEDLISNVFTPVFKALEEPHVIIYWFFTTYCRSIDLVSDEGKRSHFELYYKKASEMRCRVLDVGHFTWSFYYHSNITVLNVILSSRGLATLAFTPHLLECPAETDNAISTFLLFDATAHGIMLTQNKIHMFMYYITQIQLRVSLVSNKYIYEMEISSNPFKLFHYLGLNVVLTSDDAMVFSKFVLGMRQEYIAASTNFRLTTTCLAEINRRSFVGSPRAMEFKNETNEQYAVTPLREVRRHSRYEALMAKLVPMDGSGRNQTQH